MSRYQNTKYKFKVKKIAALSGYFFSFINQQLLS